MLIVLYLVILYLGTRFGGEIETHPLLKGLL